MEEEYDLTGFFCPVSKIKATSFIDGMNAGEKATIVLGDTDSLKTVAQELKTRGIQSEFQQEGDSRFLLTFTR